MVGRTDAFCHHVNALPGSRECLAAGPWPGFLADRRRLTAWTTLRELVILWLHYAVLTYISALRCEKRTDSTLRGTSSFVRSTCTHPLPLIMSSNPFGDKIVGRGVRGRGRGASVSGRGSKGGRGRGGRQGSAAAVACNNHRPRWASTSDANTNRKKLLVLHGNRQTGELLLGRMEKLQKTLLREDGLGWQMDAPEAPHLYSEEDDSGDDESDKYTSNTSRWQRTWWHRKGNTYQGLEESITMLHQMWNDSTDDQDFVGILGFSQGSRLAHIISILHTITNSVAFPGLQFVVHASGYGDCPMPDNFVTYLKDEWGSVISPSVLSSLDDPQYNFDEVKIQITNLHVMGENDKLVPVSSSRALMKYYDNPQVHVHPGGHHVPVKAGDVQKYVQFLKDVQDDVKIQLQSTSLGTNSTLLSDTTATPPEAPTVEPPDEEHGQSQIDEVSALAQIFPDEFQLLSESTPINLDNHDPHDYSGEARSYQHPIRYSIKLQPQDDCEQQLWPRKSISLGIKYPPTYPDISPLVSLIHDMNYLEFSLHQSEALLSAVRRAMEEEEGMPCVMSMVYAARDFFEGGGLSQSASSGHGDTRNTAITSELNATIDDEEEPPPSDGLTASLRSASSKRIEECTLQGLQIASAMLERTHSDDVGEVNGSGKGGSWKYTIGLVGKPSAGKSTLFNAATAFARQRGSTREGNINGDCDDESDIAIGGAAMAPHPFTTIDPNVGYCLVPAPTGACPEDDAEDLAVLTASGLTLGSTHGRDSTGRRLLPVCLKDVAGLVPGAYQGRGKGNKVGMLLRIMCYALLLLFLTLMLVSTVP